MKHWCWVIFTLSLLGCGSKDASDYSGTLSTVFPEYTGEPGEPDDSGEPIDPTDPMVTGFIGSPCSVDTDCPYEGGVCLSDGFPLGMCSSSCDTHCPDQDGHPVTFCVDSTSHDGFPADGGWCVSRCDFSVYSSEGCRNDYGCTIEGRHEEEWTETYACIPGDESDLTACHYELADRGVSFEPTVRAVDHPEGRPELDCIVDEPVWVLSPVYGVALEYYDGTATDRSLASCEMAHSIADTVVDVEPFGVAAIRHVGTYNCRVIGGTSSLSRHGYGDAIDIYGFRFEDGRLWTLLDHWEHDTTSPESEAAKFLYDAAHRWYDDWVWNIILTPNYNAAHDNHFHVDLSPGWHDLSVTDGRYIGPAPYGD